MIMKKIEVMFPDVENEKFFPATLEIEGDRISAIRPNGSQGMGESSLPYVFPGLVDAHVHIESSMVIPSRFAEIAVQHGTVATVSDPHEIANVLGKEGVNYMIEDAEKVPLKVFFTAPSCVPATDFEVSGARLDPGDVRDLLMREEIIALGEMMNFPGVVYDDESVHKKISAAHKLDKKVDGHAPGLEGELLEKYVAAGISTDHEAVTIEEARSKIKLGMKILIREGSAAKNFEALKDLIKEFPEEVMLCSDDLHPDDLLVGHINRLVKRSLEHGLSIWDIIRVASLNPINHYGLNVGQLRVGDPADFVLIDSVENFSVLATWIDGKEAYSNGKVSFKAENTNTPNQFITEAVIEKDIAFKGNSGHYWVIEAMDGSLITQKSSHYFESKNGELRAIPDKDILKIVVVNRYQNAPPAVGWIRNFGLKKGAIASSVAHDSHNIIAVGDNDQDIVCAINQLVKAGGGISTCEQNRSRILQLPVAGIMSNLNAENVAKDYAELTIIAKEMGSSLSAPFMTLSFMALLVIPELKIGDQGLFDVSEFKFISPRKD
jgi:adenine deaminase